MILQYLHVPIWTSSFITILPNNVNYNDNDNKNCKKINDNSCSCLKDNLMPKVYTSTLDAKFVNRQKFKISVIYTIVFLWLISTTQLNISVQRPLNNVENRCQKS
ncbi:hypothetical protein NQ314_014085 [Rhamnusium bicolor]|uniref:Transmembrane protein n=1 Tax=Rhamnusium bicolor TaxID=1586634 RepID=A0AAV8X323_9CUCU|nr:hypothetical protein NQ314_014085 [Rhamnusium bicolor]